MEKQSTVSSKKIGLSIFSMLFGAGNIIYPIKAGLSAGSFIYINFFGFLITSVLLPFIGLITMVLFNGDYKEFFGRIGRIPGFIATMFCMLILGPLLIMPRCVTVPYDVLYPFLPDISISTFSLIFCLTSFILAYKKSKILDLMSKYVSWIMLSSIGFIILAGLWFAPKTEYTPIFVKKIFLDQLLQGFQTIDLIGALFFAHIVMRLIKLNTKSENLSSKKIALMCLKGSLISGAFITILYIGLGLLGVYYKDILNSSMNGAEIFRTIAIHVIGNYGIIILAIGIIITCIATLIALSLIFSEYLQKDLLANKINYIQSLSITLLLTTLISNFGLSNILKFSMPIINFGYPIIVVITLCNAAYQLFGFKMIKLPVLVTTLAMAWITLMPFLR